MTGIKKLLICIAISLTLACLCFFICARFYLCKSPVDNDLQPKNFITQKPECHLLGQNFSEKNKTSYKEPNQGIKLLPDITRLQHNQHHYYKQCKNEILVQSLSPHSVSETLRLHSSKPIEPHPLPPKFLPPQIPFYQQFQNDHCEKNYEGNFPLAKHNFNNQHQKT